jgi:hypothetical protein
MVYIPYWHFPMSYAHTGLREGALASRSVRRSHRFVGIVLLVHSLALIVHLSVDGKPC